MNIAISGVLFYFPFAKGNCVLYYYINNYINMFTVTCVHQWYNHCEYWWDTDPSLPIVHSSPPRLNIYSNRTVKYPIKEVRYIVFCPHIMSQKVVNLVHRYYIRRS